MPTNIIMPQLGESIAEGTIVKWLIAPGDRVEKDRSTDANRRVTPLKWWRIASHYIANSGIEIRRERRIDK